MLSHISFKKILAATLICLGLASLAISGCQSGKNSTAAGSSPALASAAPPEKGGAQIWAETCARCHNYRPPTEFSAAQWDIIMHHMRDRADLTGDETRKVAAFLQASN